MKTKRTDDGQVLFWCPGCQEPHAVQATGPHAWGVEGEPYATTITPSVKVTGVNILGAPRVCHSLVFTGRIRFLNDSTHRLAGQTLDLPELPYREDSI